jgi:hypothetical protein
MIAAWINDVGRPNGNWAIEAERTKMIRIHDQTIRFDVFGLDIRPSGNWTFLQPIRKEKELRLVFVNEKDNLIATLRRVEFRNWPPFSAKSEASGPPDDQSVSLDFDLPDPQESVTQLLQRPKISVDLTSEQFGDLTVDWFEYREVGYLSRRYGRIKTKRHELLLELIARSGITSDQIDRALRPLLKPARLLD